VKLQAGLGGLATAGALQRVTVTETFAVGAFPRFTSSRWEASGAEMTAAPTERAQYPDGYASLGTKITVGAVIRESGAKVSV
jgi:hypothetical protein